MSRLCPHLDQKSRIMVLVEGNLFILFCIQVIEANEEEKKLIYSEKDAAWSKYSSQINVGNVFDGRVGSLEDYGAFVHLRFPDGT